MGSVRDLMSAVLEGDELRAEELTVRALEEGVSPVEILEMGAVAAIHEAGRLWEDGEFFLPDVILATEAFKVVMERVEPLLEPGETPRKGLVVIGSVEGDAHDLGKNIVAAFLRCAAYEVVDLGVDVPHARFVEEVRSREADILGLGAYMTTTMRGMKEVIDLLVQAGVRERVKVVVGGAAVTAYYAAVIDADGYAKDAAAAVRLMDSILGVG
ncbi:cobalamin-dependent protein [Candidatus Solincola tengchongensis]|uniref:cobalamin B12-binding domain-containing protein n=1 Tax=Candidatus Solincola tengchongensis TaxID=2900693 RepID=UPI002579E672|nr:cobalamin-dependent protein [Candidatus Solincola tengchongensis]